MEVEKSEYRRELSKVCICADLRPAAATSQLHPPRLIHLSLLTTPQYTLVFSHLLTELKEVYKDGKLNVDFTIIKQKPREFWTNFFKKR
jgi:hypothetical protein